MKRKAFSLMMAIIILLGFMPLAQDVSASAFQGGSGTKDDPWLVSTPEQLDAVRNNLGAGNHFKLINDIDLSVFLSRGVTGWTSIGSRTYNSERYNWNVKPFCGVFDGDGYIITGLWQKPVEKEFGGLFGAIDGAKIINLGVVLNDEKDGISVKGELFDTKSVDGIVPHTGVGGIVGYQTGTSVIDNCFVMGNITATYGTAGGIVGITDLKLDETSRIKNCYVMGEITSSGTAGGIVGTQTLEAASAKIQNCYFKGSIFGYPDVETSGFKGGIAGSQVGDELAPSTVEITDCYADFTVSDIPPNYLTGIGAVVGVHSFGVYGKVSVAGCVYNSDYNSALGLKDSAVGTAMSEGASYKVDAQSVPAGDMKKWSTFSGWSDDDWGIYEGKGTPYIKTIGNFILITPKQGYVKRYDTDWDITDPDAYTLEGAYSEDRPLWGSMTIEEIGGKNYMQRGSLDGVYQISFTDGMVCEIEGAEPEIVIKVLSIYSSGKYNVKYTITVKGDEKGGTPRGTVDILQDGEVIAKDVRLEKGTAVFETVEEEKGLHKILVVYNGTDYYYSVTETKTYSNNYWVLFAYGGGALIAIIIFVALLSAMKKRIERRHPRRRY